jgi:hypothetical protein
MTSHDLKPNGVEFNMTKACSYFGGSTAQFVAEILRHGIVPHGTDMYCTKSPSYKVILYALGPFVAYDTSGNGLPIVLSFDLDPRIDIRGVWHSRVTKAISTDFLAQCKLLDLPAYNKALEKYPSPIALGKAIRRAKVAYKPDFPVIRKSHSGPTDFIEDLVHFDLKPRNVTGDAVSFCTESFEVNAHIGRSSSKWELHATRIDGSSPFPREAFQIGDRNDTLNLDYFAKLDLIDLTRLNVYAEVMSYPEAVQRAVRDAVGYHFPDVGTMELPSGLLDD